MSTISNIKIQRKVRNFIKSFNWQNSLAVTLTLKQKMRIDSGQSIFITENLASKNLHHFLNKLEAKFFCRSARRRKCGLKVASVREGGDGLRLHYHLIIDCPAGIATSEFEAAIRQIWRETTWGYNEIDVQPCDHGWIDYLVKRRSKVDYATAFDWRNFRVPQNSNSINTK